VLIGVRKLHVEGPHNEETQYTMDSGTDLQPISTFSKEYSKAHSSLNRHVPHNGTPQPMHP